MAPSLRMTNEQLNEVFNSMFKTPVEGWSRSMTPELHTLIREKPHTVWQRSRGDRTWREVPASSLPRS